MQKVSRRKVKHTINCLYVLVIEICMRVSENPDLESIEKRRLTSSVVGPRGFQGVFKGVLSILLKSKH